LIIDGDAGFASALAGELIGEGYEVDVAVDRQQGIDKFDRIRPGLVLLSLSLPGGGAEGLRKLIGYRSPTTPVVMTLDDDTEAARSRVGSMNATDYVVKGGALNGVVSLIGQYLARPERRGSALKKRNTIHVLVVDDEHDHCSLIQEALSQPGRERFEVTLVHDVHGACERLASERFDCVLLDHSLPDGTGCDVLELMASELLTTVVLGLSTASDPQVAIADFRGGAADFIEKREAFKANVLRCRIFEALANYKRRVTAYVVEQREGVEAIDGCGESLIAASRIYALTGVANRGVLDDGLAAVHRQAVREGEGYAVVMIDVDRFKAYNDAYGHPAGDRVLQRVAQALRRAVRAEDIVGRYGGEEFMVLLEGINEENAARKAEDLRAAVEALDLQHDLNDAHGCVTVSVGVACYDPAAGGKESDVVSRADGALYEAKEGGRNRCVLARVEASVV
jgi:diguanylate cyclase (GGDEF)-like protein